MNYNDEYIDKIIKSTLNNSVIPNNIFEEAYNNLEYIDTSIRLKRFINIAAAIIFILTICAGTIYIFKTKNNNSNIISPEISAEDKEIVSDLPVASYTVNELGDSYQPTINHLTSPVGLTLVEEDAQFVGVVKVEKILGYTNYLKEQNIYSSTPFIKSKVSVEKIYKGNVSEELTIASYGGVISISDYEKALANRQNADARFKDFTEDEKENTYIKVINSITMSTIEPEIGKHYLVFMNYNKDLECYQVLDDLIYEYDINNNKTKNTITNEWEDYEFGKK